MSNDQLKLGTVKNEFNLKHNMTNVNVNISRIQSDMATYYEETVQTQKRLERDRLIWERIKDQHQS